MKQNRKKNTLGKKNLHKTVYTKTSWNLTRLSHGRSEYFRALEKWNIPSLIQRGKREIPLMILKNYQMSEIVM